MFFDRIYVGGNATFDVACPMSSTGLAVSTGQNHSIGNSHFCVPTVFVRLRRCFQTPLSSGKFRQRFFGRLKLHMLWLRTSMTVSCAHASASTRVNCCRWFRRSRSEFFLQIFAGIHKLPRRAQGRLVQRSIHLADSLGRTYCRV